MFGDHFFPSQAQQYLKLEFEARLRRRPAYSLRAFARDLEMSPAALSDFMNGKAGLSKDRALYLARRLNLSSDHAEHFSDLVAAQYGRTKEERDIARVRSRNRIRSKNSELSLDRFYLIADWYHMAILELVELDSRYHDTGAIARALNLKTTIVKKAVERLERLELLIREERVWRTSSPKTTVGEEVPSSAIQLFHRQILEKAALALEEQDIAKREFRSAVFSIRKRDLQDFKNDLKKQFDEIVQKYFQREGKDTIYCLSSQLFRIDSADPEVGTEK